MQPVEKKKKKRLRKNVGNFDWKASIDQVLNPEEIEQKIKKFVHRIK